VSDDNNRPDAVMRPHWNQVSDILREVRKQGTGHKDARRGTRCLAKDLPPEAQR
jgi:hypothetical protein